MAFALSLPVYPSIYFHSPPQGCLCRIVTPQCSPISMVVRPQAPSTVDKSYELERRKIGSSDLVMTEVSLGTMTWGEQNTEEEAHAQLDIAYERGVVGIDTAETYPVPPAAHTYGLTEKYIGSWLRKRGGKNFRDNVVILSKVAGASGTSRSLQWIRGSNRHVDRKNIFAAVDGILRRLGTDYIDCLQIHWPERVRGYCRFFSVGGNCHAPKSPHSF